MRGTTEDLLDLEDVSIDHQITDGASKGIDKRLKGRLTIFARCFRVR